MHEDEVGPREEAKTDRRIENAGDEDNEHNNQTCIKQSQCILGLIGWRRRLQGACLA